LLIQESIILAKNFFCREINFFFKEPESQMLSKNKIIIKCLFFYFLSFFLPISTSHSMDLLDERRLGNVVLQSIWNSKSIISDIESQIYIKELGQDLVKKSNQPLRHFDFFLLADKSVNAFASWNGYIGVHDALVLFSDNESELAAILAHEISHITQDHLKRFHDKSSKQRILTIGGLIASVLVKNSEVTKAIVHTSIANDMQNQINYTREHEWEADNFSMNLLERTDFNVNGLGDFFERMQSDKSSTDYLRTHPLNVDRIANSQSRARNFKRTHNSSFDYETLKIRLLNTQSTNYEDHKLDLYSKAYKSFTNDRVQEASNHIEDLLKIKGDFSSLILAGRIFGKLKQEKKSEDFFELAKKYRNNEVVRYFQSKMYLNNNKPLKAIKILKSPSKMGISSVLSENLLAEAYLRISEQDRYQFHRGAAELLKGNFEKATEHFYLAKNLTQSQDFYDIVNSIIKSAEEEWKILEFRD